MDSRLNAVTRNASFVGGDEIFELQEVPFIVAAASTLGMLVEIVNAHRRWRRETRSSMPTRDHERDD